MIAVNGAMKMAKVTVPDILSKKEKGEKITQLTAYDFPSAQLVDEAGIDMILVGDSLGTVVLGYENSLPVTVDDIVHHTRPVARGAKRALIVGDLPCLSYHLSHGHDLLLLNLSRGFSIEPCKSVRASNASSIIDIPPLRIFWPRPG